MRFACRSLLLPFIVIPVLFAACSKKELQQTVTEHNNEPSEIVEADGRIIVGFSQIGAESAWRIYNTYSVRKAADAEDVQLLFVNAEQKQENQIKAIRSFIMYQVDVIAFVPIVQDGWGNVLNEAKEAGIPVIVCDRKIDAEYDNLYEGYVGTDSVEEGRKAARFLQQKYSGTKETLNILELRGTDGSSASEGRIKGFREVIGNDGRFNIVYSVSGDFMRSRGEEIARNILAAGNGKFEIDGNKIDILFSCNDGMTLGFIEVLKSLRIKTGKNGVTVITFDAQQEAIDALKAGDLNCVVECNPDIGDAILSLAKRLANGETIPRLTHVQEGIFTEFDDLSSLPERGY